MVSAISLRASGCGLRARLQARAHRNHAGFARESGYSVIELIIAVGVLTVVSSTVLTGVLNLTLRDLGLMGAPVPWLAQFGTAILSLILVNTWRGFPFFGITLLAGMQAIPQELYEAAEVDGASRWQRFWRITVPSLRTVILVVTILSTIWTFNDFGIVWLLTGGGPGHAMQREIAGELECQIGCRRQRRREAGRGIRHKFRIGELRHLQCVVADIVVAHRAVRRNGGKRHHKPGLFLHYPPVGLNHK